MRDTTVTPSKLRLPYMAGLDGVRAISVLAVFFYHANFPWAMGGFLGVESFFVISGYLITSLLLREYQATHQLALGRFWLRRARRLLPALFLVLVAVVPLAWQLAPDALPRLREDVPGALLYVTNWLFVYRRVPYFEQFGRPPLLQHLWSLAVEEQFYLVWPVALMGLLHILRRRNAKQSLWLVTAILLAVGASSALMAILYDPRTDPTRAYYGTDTRAAGFLLGAALAAVWVPGRKAVRGVGLMEAAGFGGLTALLLLFTSLNEYTPFLYRGGFALTALATCLVVLAVSGPQTRLARLLGCTPLRWIGTRSYGIYLWHWPLMILGGWGRGSAQPHGATIALQMGLTFLLAELSYRWIEAPIRQRGLRAWWLASTQHLGGLRVNAASIVCMIVLVGCVAVYPNSGSPAQASSEMSAPSTVALASPVAPTQRRSGLSAVAAPSVTPTQQPSASMLMATSTPTASPQPAEDATRLEITFIGDSIMESVVPWIEASFEPGSYHLDAIRKRRMEDALTLIPVLAARGVLGETVVIHLGTNVPFEKTVFDDVMLVLLEHGVKRVLFLNVKRPVAWEYFVNNQLEEGVNRWPQAEIVDWHRLSKSQTGWFGADSVHPTFTGAEAYVGAIQQALWDTE